MKTILTVILIILSFVVFSQNEISDSTIQAEAIPLADSICVLDSVLYRPVLVVDTSNNYFLVFGDYALQVKQIYMRNENSKGDLVSLTMKTGEFVNIEFVKKPIYGAIKPTKTIDKYVKPKK